VEKCKLSAGADAGLVPAHQAALLPINIKNRNKNPRRMCKFNISIEAIPFLSARACSLHRPVPTAGPELRRQIAVGALLAAPKMIQTVLKCLHSFQEKMGRDDAAEMGSITRGKVRTFVPGAAEGTDAQTDGYRQRYHSIHVSPTVSAATTTKAFTMGPTSSFRKGLLLSWWTLFYLLIASRLPVGLNSCELAPLGCCGHRRGSGQSHC
jgi:hypothetical protein